MILRWVQRGPSEFVSKWQEKNLLLQYENGLWQAYVDGAKITHVQGEPHKGWHTYVMGMEAIDGFVQKLVVQMGKKAVAQQLPQSAERIHRRA